jgi:hypothetical protein
MWVGAGEKEGLVAVVTTLISKICAPYCHKARLTALSGSAYQRETARVSLQPK